MSLIGIWATMQYKSELKRKQKQDTWEYFLFQFVLVCYMSWFYFWKGKLPGWEKALNIPWCYHLPSHLTFTLLECFHFDYGYILYHQAAALSASTWVQWNLGPGTGEKRMVVTPKIHRALRRIFPMIKAHRYHEPFALKHFVYVLRQEHGGSNLGMPYLGSNHQECFSNLKLCCSLQPPLNQDWLLWCFYTLLHCLALLTEGKVSSVLQVPPGWVLPASVWEMVHVWPWKVQHSFPMPISQLWGWPKAMVFILWVIFPTLARDKHLTDHLPMIFSWSAMLLAIPHLPLHFSSSSLRFSKALTGVMSESWHNIKG